MVKNNERKFRGIVFGVLAVSLVCLAYACYGWMQQAKALSAKQEELGQVQAQLDESKSREAYDEVTGLYNFEEFQKRMQQSLQESGPKQAWMYITFKSTKLGNDLKYINDTYGHIAGRQAMIDFAEAMKDVFPSDRYLLGHMGGSAYLVLDTRFKGREDVLAKIRQFKQRWHDTPWTYDGHRVEHPALNLAIAEVDASSDLESIRRRLFSLNKQSREEALFVYCFLGDEPVME